MGKEKGFRNRVMKALHAEAIKRGISHEDLREMFSVHSLGLVETKDLVNQLRAWGKRMRVSQLPRKGYATKAAASPEMVSGEDLTLLGDAFQRRGWTQDQRNNFIRRQLGGRETIRTRADFHRVFSGVRAMNRRDEQCGQSK